MLPIKQVLTKLRSPMNNGNQWREEVSSLGEITGELKRAGVRDISMAQLTVQRVLPTEK